MEEKTLQTILISILRSELLELPPDEAWEYELTEEMLPALYRAAKTHDLAHIVSSFLGKYGHFTENEWMKKFKKQELLSIYRLESMKYEISRISECLEKASMPYILLKGAVLRPYYPKEMMRTSCDIDILIREEQLEEAILLLQKEGYRFELRNRHDVSFYSESGVHLELHFSLIEIDETLDVVLKRAWSYAEQKNGAEYAFTEGFFLFHIYAHMEHHFLQGGCGIRSLMDLWIAEHKMGISLADAEPFFKETHLERFAQGFHALSEMCFSGQEMTKDGELLLTYLMTGNLYGGAENQVALGRSETEHTSSYVWKRIFLPYYTMAVYYPILKKAPFLLPLYWMIRIFKVIFSKGRRKGTMKELQQLKQSDAAADEKMKNMKRLREHLGL